MVKWVNRMLAVFGIQLLKNSTLQRLQLQGREASTMTASMDALSVQIEAAKKTNLKHQISLYWRSIDRERKALIGGLKTLICPLCDFSGKLTLFKVYETECMFEGGHLLRHQCPNCDLVFGDQKMLALSEVDLSKEYEWHYQVFAEGDSTEQEMRAFYALSPKKDGVYVNWGAGAWSQSLQRLREVGWNVYGYEPHQSANTQAPFIIFSEAELLSMQFDGIFSNNVLEHFRYPVRELSLMASLLKANGRMSHATPCFEYLYEFTRFHLFFYLGRSRQLLASQSGLEIEQFHVDHEFMNLVLKKAS